MFPTRVLVFFRKIFDPATRFSRNEVLIFGAISFVLSAVLAGVLENSIYDILKENVHPKLLRHVTLNYYWLATTIFSGLLLGIFLGILVTRHFLHTGSAKVINQLSNIDKIVKEVRSQLYWEIINEVDVALYKAIDEGCSDSLFVFIDAFFDVIFSKMGVQIVNGGAILLPDPENPDILKFWRMSKENPLSPKQFYIGIQKSTQEINLPRGAAGKAYLENRPVIVRILDRVTGVSDESSYHNFGIDRPIIPYSSFIALPIRWPNKVIGVLSIESQEVNTFSYEDAEFLVAITGRLGAALNCLEKDLLSNISINTT